MALGIALCLAPCLAAAEPSGQDCKQSENRDLRACSDLQAANILHSAATLACNGDCVIRQDGPDAIILNPKGQMRHRVAGAVFLAGLGQTRCLQFLPFLTDADAVIVLDSRDFSIHARLSLDGIYDTPLADDANLRDQLIATGQLSCDARRFFIPLQDEAGFALLDLSPEAARPPSPPDPMLGQPVFPSPSGRYGLWLDGVEGRYQLRDFVTGAGFPTTAQPELDLPFFDISESHLLIRRHVSSGMSIDIIDLPTGQKLATVPYPPESGLDFHVTQGNQGFALVPLSP